MVGADTLTERRMVHPFVFFIRVYSRFLFVSIRGVSCAFLRLFIPSWACPVCLVSQNVEPGRATGAGVHRQVCQNQRRARRNKIAHVRIELGRDPKPICNLF
jgi:hypothetical protein